MASSPCRNELLHREEIDRMRAVLLLSFFCALLPGAALAAGYPHRSIEGAVDGTAAPFAGNWQMLWPQGPEDSGGEVVTGCDTPVVIAPKAETRAEFTLPTSAYREDLELVAALGGTRWKPPQGSGFFTVWVSADSFYLYDIDMMGRPGWSSPRRLDRCP